MKRFHVIPERNEANGVCRVADLLAQEDGGTVCTCAEAASSRWTVADEVWVHGAWLPMEWRVCRKALGLGCRLVRMTHGSFSPVYLKGHGRWKKRMAGPVERFFLRRADRVMATCEAEAGWIRAYEPRVKAVEITELKRFFDLGGNGRVVRTGGAPLRLLYLGRRHPLKGIVFLEEAVRAVKRAGRAVELCVACNTFGEQKERMWDWCDVLVLPTLSENFGLVVAEALERGKRVITTDGAPAWGDVGDCGGRLTYLVGFRDGNDERRVRLLEKAIARESDFLVQ